MTLLLQVAADVPTSVYAIGFAVVTALVGALGVSVKLFLSEVAGRREDNKSATAAILAERAAAAPLLESVGKLAAAVSEQSTLVREQRDSNVRVAAAVDRQTESYKALIEQAMMRRSASVTNQAAVK